MTDNSLHLISLGAGVQSSAMALMAAAGEITPMPVAAVFADTRAEPDSVYRWLDWLTSQLPFPVIKASHGDLGADSTRLRTSGKTGNTYLSPSLPVYTTVDGKKGMMMRQCTRDYKISIVRREAAKLMRVAGVKHNIQWIGISVDEAQRMKPSRHPRTTNIWPLIDMGMSRQACLDWMEKRGYPRPPRSACTFCPYHSDAEWVRLRADEPEAFAQAVAYEARLTAAVRASTAMRADAAYLHASRVPLPLVEFRPQQPKGDQFGNECEGMCGV